MNLNSPPTHTVEVETPAEAREVLEAAETLGLDLRDVKVRGWWKGRTGAEPSRGSTWSLQPRTRDARTWFYLAGDGYEPFAAKPRRATVDGAEDGTLELRFDRDGGRR